ncbi:hypothetical protein MHU86_13680 [Fragilaria crotonensis]|nr:hypothetical protein MHU86_13680 [Fragilaria crotonensis]
MMRGSAALLTSAPVSLPLDDDPVFGFSTSKWIEPPDFDPNPPETQRDRYNRLHSETDFRNSHTPTAWYRYSVLGHYAVSGELFEMMWTEFETDPIRLHSVIWYNYMYQIERKKLIPDKLQAWATKISQPFLAVKDPSVLTIDTLETTWYSMAAIKGFSITPWKKVGPQKARSQNSKTSKSMDLHSLGFTRSFRRASLLAPPPKTIQEEPEPTPVETTPVVESINVETNDPPPETAATFVQAKVSDTNNDGLSTESQDGKVSAIIPNLNVPVNDGTYRITIRWKTKIDPNSTSRQSSSLSTSIYSLLNELFSDDDGLLYHWGTEGLEKYNSISHMTPQEVRSFICPSITLMPSQSMMIIPLRFGFTSKTPSAWRNLETTKATLEKYNATVSFSNSKSTSGKLVIAGYILLKAQ